MMRFLVIGVLENDAVVNYHGQDTVINFTLKHTQTTTPKEDTTPKVTWIDCAWWTPKTHMASRLKKGDKVYLDGIPALKTFKRTADGSTAVALGLRVNMVELLVPATTFRRPHKDDPNEHLEPPY